MVSISELLALQRLKVKTHEHVLIRNYNDNGWSCDGRKLAGCARGCTGFSQSSGWPRFRCELCNFDFCDQCALRDFDRSFVVLDELQDQATAKDGSIEVKDIAQEEDEQKKSNDDCGLQVTEAIICSLCFVQFSYFDDLIAHCVSQHYTADAKATQHSLSVDEPEVCQACESQFLNAEELIAHYVSQHFIDDGTGDVNSSLESAPQEQNLISHSTSAMVRTRSETNRVVERLPITFVQPRKYGITLHSSSNPVVIASIDSSLAPSEIQQQFRSNDQIISINGVNINSVEDAMENMKKARLGQRMTFVIQRNVQIEWQWLGDDGNWNPYSDVDIDVQCVIERAYQDKTTVQCTLMSNGNKQAYCIDTVNMQQKNLSNDNLRKIKRGMKFH